MTGPDDSETSTRPISVAELLAKNGTIGAAPPGGRRRRRRGNSDAVTVAELTGEIPIVRTGELPRVAEKPVAEKPVAEKTVAEEPADKEPAADEVAAEPTTAEVEATPEPDSEEVESDEAATDEDATDEAATAEDATAEDATQASAQTNGSGSTDTRPPVRPELADVPVARRGPATKPERSHFPMVSRKGSGNSASDPSATAETMNPDPIVEETPSSESPSDTDGRPDELGLADSSSLQTYLRATSGPLFGGQTVADDLARHPRQAGDDVVGDELEVEEALRDDTAEDADTDAGDRKDSDKEKATKTAKSKAPSESSTKGQMAVRGLLIAVQSIVAVVFGAGLFIAFDQLWKWNSIVALVLGVLVILGLVVGVRVVRKTEDIGSTLTAVAVGALVTFGPLALLQAS
ncbi:MAG: hypothetical protein K0R68_3012 [Mycobacterium sp.]|nr:hypothetical protein [Mycobacterium sp.]